MVPNDIFLLGLSPGELAVYIYLLRCENRNTYQCWPSYATIGENVGMSVNIVRKNVKLLEVTLGLRTPTLSSRCPFNILAY